MIQLIPTLESELWRAMAALAPGHQLLIHVERDTLACILVRPDGKRIVISVDGKDDLLSEVTAAIALSSATTGGLS